MQTLKCPQCGFVGSYDFSEIKVALDQSYMHCYICDGIITLTTEGVTVENTGKKTCFADALPVLENGETVIITNEEHPWTGELALICGTKHKHYRIELLGHKIWVPFEWVRPLNDSP